MRSDETGGLTCGFMRKPFIDRGVRLRARRGEPVVDRFAEAFVRDRHYGDGCGAGGIERAQM